MDNAQKLLDSIKAIAKQNEDMKTIIKLQKQIDSIRANGVN